MSDNLVDGLALYLGAHNINLWVIVTRLYVGISALRLTVSAALIDKEVNSIKAT